MSVRSSLPVTYVPHYSLRYLDVASGACRSGGLAYTFQSLKLLPCGSRTPWVFSRLRMASPVIYVLDYLMGRSGMRKILGSAK